MNRIIEALMARGYPARYRNRSLRIGATRIAPIYVLDSRSGLVRLETRSGELTLTVGESIDRIVALASGEPPPAVELAIDASRYAWTVAALAAERRAYGNAACAALDRLAALSRERVAA